MKNSLLIFLIALSLSLSAQSEKSDSVTYNKNKISIENLKNQPYLKYASKIKCDSADGTTLEIRICANLELQKQDSLLQIELRTLILERQENQDTLSIIKINLSQNIWEQNRYAHCRSCLENGTSFDMILFMRCAIELTLKRRDDIKNLCGYY